MCRDVVIRVRGCDALNKWDKTSCFMLLCQYFSFFISGNDCSAVAALTVFTFPVFLQTVTRSAGGNSCAVNLQVWSLIVRLKLSQRHSAFNIRLV